MKTLVALFALALAALVVPSSAEAAPRACQGQPATITASKGEVRGTAGGDVIVAMGSVKRVLAEGGEDLVCLVRTTGPVWVDPGAGNDTVDVSAARAKTSISLDGADRFIGSRYEDYVRVAPGPDPARATLATGRGPDTVLVETGAAVDARLDRGRDNLGLYSADGGAASTFDLGPGTDRAYFEDDWEAVAAGETSLLVDLTEELVTWHGVTHTMRNAENAGGGAQHIRMVGDAGPNRLSGRGCDVLIKGGHGRDWLSLVSTGNADVAPNDFDCETSRLRARGNAGNDHLRGGRRDDILIGGSGFDTAYGVRGNDVCRVERVYGKSCQRASQ